MASKAEILIIGGTGQVGGELISLLSTRETSVRVLVRKETAIKSLQTSLVDPVSGSLEDRSSLAQALKGIKKVFLICRDHPKQGELEGNVIDLAGEMGVEMLIKSSAYAAGLDPPVGYGIVHAQAEQRLKASSLNWVILRPYVFMQNFLEVSQQIKSPGIIPFPFGKAKIGLIDARDVALAASTILTTEGHANRIYELTGPELLSIEACAKILSERLGRRIRYVSPPFWLPGLIMKKQGFSSWDVAMRKALFQMVKEGGEARVTDDFRTIVGHEPRSLDDFFSDHLKQFV